MRLNALSCIIIFRVHCNAKSAIYYYVVTVLKGLQTALLKDMQKLLTNSLWLVDPSLCLTRKSSLFNGAYPKSLSK